MKVIQVGSESVNNSRNINCMNCYIFQSIEQLKGLSICTRIYCKLASFKVKLVPQGFKNIFNKFQHKKDIRCNEKLN